MATYECKCHLCSDFITECSCSNSFIDSFSVYYTSPKYSKVVKVASDYLESNIFKLNSV